MKRKISIYIPERPIKQGYLFLIKEMFSDIAASRWLTYQIFKRNFAGAYRQSTLGIFWAFIVPFGSVGIFIFLNQSGIFNVGETQVPYPLFALTGMALWQVFSVGVTIGPTSLIAAGPMIKRTDFPRA